MDTVSEKKRSEIMSKIRSKNTQPELLLKSALTGLRFRYQPKIKGKPDFASKKHMIAIFVDGCFWHGCPTHCRLPKSKQKYWYPKILKNIERDKVSTKVLQKEGWKVLRFWEHEIRCELDLCIAKIRKTFNN